MDMNFELFIYGILTQIQQIGVWWLAGILTGSAISVFLSDKIVAAVSAFRQKNYNFWASLAAAALGVASPVCMFGTIPLIVALGRKGVPQYLLVTFMISSILLNPTLLVMSFALGIGPALIRLLVSLLGGLLAGLLAALFLRKRQIFQFSQFETEPRKKKAFWADVLKALRITAPYLLIGIILTALFDQYFPKELLAQLFGKNRGLGILFAVSLSVPLYVCGGGTIPLMAAWLQSGMSLGSAVAFMIAGPATKITNLGAVKIILGWRNFLIYLVYCVLFALVAGILVNWFF
jgi:uncharacterized membrane protein YraQ (UPF0718 family)